MKAFGKWFRHAVLGRSTMQTSRPHSVCVGDTLEVAGASSGNGIQVVTRVLSPFEFETRRPRRNHFEVHLSKTARYLIKMLTALLLGLWLVVKSSHLAADGKIVSACLVGFIVFGLFIFMAAVSVKAEREAGNE